MTNNAKSVNSVFSTKCFLYLSFETLQRIAKYIKKFPNIPLFLQEVLNNKLIKERLNYHPRYKFRLENIIRNNDIYYLKKYWPILCEKLQFSKPDEYLSLIIDLGNENMIECVIELLVLTKNNFRIVDYMYSIKSQDTFCKIASKYRNILLNNRDTKRVAQVNARNGLTQECVNALEKHKNETALGHSCLNNALLYNQLETFNALVNNGIRVSIETVLIMMKYNYTELLRKHIPDVYNEFFWYKANNFLYENITKLSYEVLQIIHQQGKSKNWCLFRQQYCITNALKHKNLPLVEQLFKLGCNVYFEAALKCAAKQNIEVVKYVHENRSRFKHPLNNTEVLNYDIPHCVTQDIALYLLKKGYVITDTCWKLAITENYIDVFSCLLKEHTNTWKPEIYCEAVKSRKIDLVKLFWSNKLKMNKKCSETAAEMQDWETLIFLKQNNCPFSLKIRTIVS